jgi:hypothetical protein
VLGTWIIVVFIKVKLPFLRTCIDVIIVWSPTNFPVLWFYCNGKVISQMSKFTGSDNIESFTVKRYAVYLMLSTCITSERLILCLFFFNYFLLEKILNWYFFMYFWMILMF